MSPQGQEINLANLQLGRPIKPASTLKTITATSAGNISVVPQKQLFVRKVVSPSGSTKNIVKPLYSTKTQEQHFMVVQKAEPNSTTTHVSVILLESLFFDPNRIISGETSSKYFKSDSHRPHKNHYITTSPGNGAFNQCEIRSANSAKSDPGFEQRGHENFETSITGAWTNSSADD